jgi:hypothetical protein
MVLPRYRTSLRRGLYPSVGRTPTGRSCRRPAVPWPGRSARGCRVTVGGDVGAPSQSVAGFDRVERSDDGLDWEAAAGDQLGTRATQRRSDGRRPAVLPEEHGGEGARLQRDRGLLEVLIAQQARGRAPSNSAKAAATCLRSPTSTADTDPSSPLVRNAMSRIRMMPRPLQDHIVDRAQLLQLLFAHGLSFVCASKPESMQRRACASPDPHDVESSCPRASGCYPLARGLRCPECPGGVSGGGCGVTE